MMPELFVPLVGSHLLFQYPGPGADPPFGPRRKTDRLRSCRHRWPNGHATGKSSADAKKPPRWTYARKACGMEKGLERLLYNTGKVPLIFKIHSGI